MNSKTNAVEKQGEAHVPTSDTTSLTRPQEATHGRRSRPRTDAAEMHTLATKDRGQLCLDWSKTEDSQTVRDAGNGKGIKASPTGAAEPRPDSCSRSDTVLAALRGNLREFAPRRRQGVVFPRSMFREDACQMAQELRQRTEGGEPLATVSCFGSLVGLTPTIVPDVRIEPVSAADVWPPFHVDLDQGCVRYDLDRIVEKADPALEGCCVPATRWVRLPLPGFLIDALRKRRAHQAGQARQLCDLLGRPTWEGRARATAGAGYRLKPTLIRFRGSLGPILLDEGHSAVVASVSLVEFELGTKSNLAYVTFPQELVNAALGTLNRALGWD